MNTHGIAESAARSLLDDCEADGASRLVMGPPRSGKTTLAVALLVEGLRRYGGERAVMTVSGRTLADELSNQVIRALGSSAQARPVTTLGAVAFRLIAASRAMLGSPAPRLLNGAEQDALLRRVMGVHLGHALAGDDCPTCALLREYFAHDQWSSLVRDAASGAATEMPVGGSSSAELFARGISNAFIAQLRDILARLDELGVTRDNEPSLLSASASDQRLNTQWRLAFALRREYIGAQAKAYPDEYRLDASYLLVAGAQAVSQAETAHMVDALNMPQLLVVDDAQDITFAALRFLETLAHAGTRLVLVGNPDEAVQTFRGAYPETIMRLAVEGELHAVTTPMPHIAVDQGSATDSDKRQGPYQLDVLASRVSLSIPSPEQEPLPMAQRPWKLTEALHADVSVWQTKGDQADGPQGEADKDDRARGRVSTALYRSSREELDDVVWRIKHAHLDDSVAWNDMAVIAHDNATVRLFGERLRRDGVPVQYSSVSRPMKSEPLVQSLFALVELARLRAEGIAGCGMTLPEMAAYIRSRVITLMAGPLVTTGAKPGYGAPGRIPRIESAMESLEVLADLSQEGTVLRGLLETWQALRDAMPVLEPSAEDERVRVDDEVMQPENEQGLAFGMGALYVMLGCDDAHAPTTAAMQAIGAVLGKDPQMRAFSNLWTMVGKTAKALEDMPASVRNEPRYALFAAWDAAGVATAWQRTALMRTAEGRAANDRLDAAMRIFQFAEDSTASRDITGFIAQVRGMEMQADSLAHVSPVDQAVTLTTPAGSAGRHWNHVWLPSIQQDVWPNLAERNTMFGGEELAALMLRGSLPEHDVSGRDLALNAVLSGEKKSLLVALTRAEESVALSAVWNDDTIPSDFLFGYLPERYHRNIEQAQFTTVGQQSEANGLDADPRGLVASCRAVLINPNSSADQREDAAAALAALAKAQVTSADPDHWAFVTGGQQDQADTTRNGQTVRHDDPDESDDPNGLTVELSPSSVDRIWSCPVCWLLENKYSGPQPGSAATSFGSLIHRIAELGSQMGLDHLEAHPELAKDLGLKPETGEDMRIEAVSGKLYELYQQERPDLSVITDTAQRYKAMAKDDSAKAALDNIASYFVASDRAPEDYLARNAKNFRIGKLKSVECERWFSARFDLNDILTAYNALPGMTPIDRRTLMACMGTQVGGWPEGMDERLTIHLSGRIDRMEQRVMPDGSASIRLIDYKTGDAPSLPQIFGDLQLVCYQLGLTFPEGGKHGAEALNKAPNIGQSALFHVQKHAAPAESYAPESLFQTPLFINGSLNAEAFTKRFYYGSLDKLTDMPVPDPQSCPEGVNAGDWERFSALAGTQSLWSLTMIARVFYAAAVLRSSRLVAHPQSEHLKYCTLTAVCPACAGQIDTVYETRQA